MKNLPLQCPSCESPLAVSKMTCPSCNTEVNGKYDLPILLRLSRENQEFIINFLLSSGSIKEMAKQAGLSYPTMRNKMDDLIESIKKEQL